MAAHADMIATCRAIQWSIHIVFIRPLLFSYHCCGWVRKLAEPFSMVNILIVHRATLFPVHQEDNPAAENQRYYFQRHCIWNQNFFKFPMWKWQIPYIPPLLPSVFLKNKTMLWQIKNEHISVACGKNHLFIISDAVQHNTKYFFITLNVWKVFVTIRETAFPGNHGKEQRYVNISLVPMERTSRYDSFPSWMMISSLSHWTIKMSFRSFARVTSWSVETCVLLAARRILRRIFFSVPFSFWVFYFRISKPVLEAADQPFQGRRRPDHFFVWFFSFSIHF